MFHPTKLEGLANMPGYFQAKFEGHHVTRLFFIHIYIYYDIYILHYIILYYIDYIVLYNILYYIILYDIILYYIISYYIISYHIILYHIISFHFISYRIISYLYRYIYILLYLWPKSIELHSSENTCSALVSKIGCVLWGFSVTYRRFFSLFGRTHLGKFCAPVSGNSV